MNSRLKFATLALCTAPFLLAQTDPSKPSANNPAPPDKTPPPAASQAKQNQNQNNTPAAPAAAAPDTNKQQASAAPAPAQPATTARVNPPAPAEQPRPNIQFAADDAKNRTAKRYIGWRVKSSNRDELGKVKDFFIDTQTGKAEFALISSGGVAGVGDKLRLVPATALKRIGESKDFMLEIAKDRWETLATVDEKDLKSGRLTIPDAQRREIASHFEHSTGTPRDSGFYSASITSHLVRASDLDGRDVRAGNDRLGKIEAVVLDLDSGAANALVEPNKSFTGTKQKLLVPFNALAVGDGKRPQVSTLISRADFQPLLSGNPTPSASAMAASTTPTPAPAEPRATAQPSSEKAKVTAGVASTDQSSAQPSPTGRSEMPKSAAEPATNQKSNVATNESPAQPKESPAQPKTNNEAAQPTKDQAGRVASTDKPSATKDENLTPTGQSSADAVPAGADPALVATARAIRKALDDDPALASADVRVTPEAGGKIALRGHVSDQKTKTSIVETATREIKGWKIDDQISVENR